MKNLVTVTCNRDFQHMLLQAESIQKFVEPCIHWIIINEYDEIDIYYWDSKLSPYYTKHQCVILTPDDFVIKPINQREWHSQQFYKLYISTYINEDYLILDTKSFFIKPVTLKDWSDTTGSGVLHKFGESIDGPPWEGVSKIYAKKLNTTPLTHFLFNVPFKIDNNVLKKYDIEKLIHDLYFSTEEEEEYMNKNGKHLFPSEFILYSYLAEHKFKQFNPKPCSFVYVVPANIKNKNEDEILAVIIIKTLMAEPNPDITSFAFHPLIFEKLSKRHINYINKWLYKLNFSFQFTLN